MKILIVKLSSIGDVTHTLAALDSLKRGFPEARIDWLVEQSASGLLAGHPMIDDLMVARHRGWRRTPFKNLALAKRLASKRYDMVLDFQGLFKSGLWVWLSRGRRCIGFENSRELSHVFLNDKAPAFDIEKHAVDRYLELARYAGGAGGDVSFPLLTGAEESSRVSVLLKEAGIGEGCEFFVVNPFARWVTKLWPGARFVEFLRLASKRLKMKAVVIGSAGDSVEAEAIVKGAGIGDKAVSLAGKTGLKELAHLLRIASFVVTVDSGPMHIAAAVATPTIALFGPTAPWRTGPYGPGHRIVRKEVSCGPCFKKRCKDPGCMSEITAEEVVSAVEVHLGLCLEPVSETGPDKGKGKDEDKDKGKDKDSAGPPKPVEGAGIVFGP